MKNIKAWIPTILKFIFFYTLFSVLNLTGAARNTTVQNAVGDLETLTQSAMWAQIWGFFLSAGMALILHFHSKGLNEKEK